MITFEVDPPPSPNRWPSSPMAIHHAKAKYRAHVWMSAIEQLRPMLDPPQLVKVTITMTLRLLRDEDNLKASVKWLLDALHARQQGKVKWKKGLYTNKAYFVDDSPKHMQLEVNQVMGRPQHCLVVIETIEEKTDG